MSKKECIVLQPKETIVDVEYSDGTVVRTESRFWYEGEVAHLKFFVCDNKQITKLKHQLAEKDRENEKLKENQTPTDKELKPQEYDNYNLADKLRYRECQVRIALERLQKLYEEIETLRFTIDEMSNANKNIHKAFEVSEKATRHQICEEIKIKGYYCHNGEEKYYKITPSMLWEIEKGE